MSPADFLASLPAAERDAFLASLNPAETIALLGLLNGESSAACRVRLERASRLRRMARDLDALADDVLRRR